MDDQKVFEFHSDITAPFSASPNALIYPTERCGIAVPAHEQIYGTEAIRREVVRFVGGNTGKVASSGRSSG